MKTIATRKTIMMAAAVIGLLNVPLARGADGCCAAPPTKDSKVTLTISGMTCDKCVTVVQKALQKVDGVKAAAVSLDKGQAVVTVDAAKVKTEQLIAAVNRAGGDRHAFKAQKSDLYKCARCGQIYGKAGSCCGAPTKKLESP